jgi:hypothetical protein
MKTPRFARVGLRATPSFFGLLALLAPAIAPAAGTPRTASAKIEAPWLPRAEHTSLSFAGKIWVLGGLGWKSVRNVSLNDVWSSPGGAVWTRVTASAPWWPRTEHCSVVHKDRMWVMGGIPYYSFSWTPGRAVSATNSGTGDVWSSANGVDWTTVTTKAPWGSRWGHGAVAHDGAIFLMGGETYTGTTPTLTLNSDVWRSEDGGEWTEVASSAPWKRRTGHAAVVHQGKIWVIGGYQLAPDKTFVPRRDVWSSPDGAEWTNVTNAAPWVERILRYSKERYVDTATGRLVAVGRDGDRLVMVPHEREGNVLTPVTVHVTTRQQINSRVRSERFRHE